MNLLTYVMHLVGSGAFAYYSAAQIRDSKTRPNILAGFQLAESGSVPFLTALSERAAAEGDTWLAQKLKQHASDETRHGQIFAHGLKQLKKQVIDWKSQPQTTSTDQSQQQRSPFFAAFFEGYSPEQLKPAVIDWNVFMGSTYILELDASKDFPRMAKALPDDEPIARNLKLGILSVAKDETTHAAYLYEAMTRRMSLTQVQELIDEWRTRKVNATFAFASNLLQGKSPNRSLVQDSMPSQKDSQLIGT
ncbi:ferritin-like domain-containing protein [Nostoc linckia FACHB-104]|nr:ferritin-like domain-containing protein [Nostoc linckia FACHB-104]